MGKHYITEGYGAHMFLRMQRATCTSRAEGETRQTGYRGRLCCFVLGVCLHECVYRQFTLQPHPGSRVTRRGGGTGQ